MSNDVVRILIIDDSALYRMLLHDVLRGLPGCEVVGLAEDGTRGLEMIAQHDPDLVTLDVEMPGLTGIDVLRKMKRTGARARAIMVSRHTTEGAQTTLDALFEGAFDFILKPSGKDPAQNKSNLRQSLENKIAAFRASPDGVVADSGLAEVDVEAEPTLAQWRCDLVVIGASTGGPELLRSILPLLPSDLPVPIVVVQHMPPQFTEPLASRLDRLCPLTVQEASHQSTLEPGTVYIAKGGHHLRIEHRGDATVGTINDDEPEHNFRPAIDYTLRSACEVLGNRVLAVILTGMGRDGLDSCRILRERGGRVIAQHEEGCTVFGMPKAIIQSGHANRIVKWHRLPRAIRDEVGRGRL